MIKKGKEIKMGKSYKNYNVVSGTVDSKNPRSIYINISAWGEPINEHDDNYVRVISGLNKRVKSFLYNNVPLPFNNKKTIVDLDIRESGITIGKRSFMSCEITLYQSDSFGKGNLLMSEDLKKSMGTITEMVIKEVFDTDDHFQFYKKKN